MAYWQDSKMAYVGIDPGLNGAVAVIRHGTVEAYVTPTVRRTKTRRMYDELEMVRLVYGIAEPVVFYIERQQAWHGQGVTSTFSTGYGFGLWCGILAAAHKSHVVVAPKVWQKAVAGSFPKGESKARVLAAVQSRFPDVDLRASNRCRKPHDGIVDAIGIAWYAMIKERGLT